MNLINAQISPHWKTKLHDHIFVYTYMLWEEILEAIPVKKIDIRIRTAVSVS